MTWWRNRHKSECLLAARSRLSEVTDASVKVQEERLQETLREWVRLLIEIYDGDFSGFQEHGSITTQFHSLLVFPQVPIPTCTCPDRYDPECTEGIFEEFVTFLEEYTHEKIEKLISGNIWPSLRDIQIRAGSFGYYTRPDGSYWDIWLNLNIGFGIYGGDLRDWQDYYGPWLKKTGNTYSGEYSQFRQAKREMRG